VTAADLLRAALAADAAALLRVNAQLRDAPSAADVHAARVSVRRLRGHLRTFAPLLDDAWADDLAERLRWLGNGLSAARDADVLLARVGAAADGIASIDPQELAQALEPFRARQSAAYARLAELIHDPRCPALLAALADAAREPQLTAAAAAPAESMVGILMKPVWRRLRKAVRRAGRVPADADLHRIRIKAKVLRYAAEALEPVAGRRAKRFARRVEALQAQLGKQHDAVNAAGILREHLSGPHAAAVNAELVARESAVATELRRRWRPRWKRIDDADARFW
jgi:CHAD domain-containing protein